MLSDLNTSIIIGLLVGGVGLILIFANWRVFFLENQVSKWPKVEGVITRSKMGIHFTSMNRGEEWFYPDIEYRYEVRGVLYTGTVLDLVQLSQHGAPQYVYFAYTLLDFIKQYPEGLAVSVYFNPTKPGQAVLNIKASRAISVNFFLGLVFVDCSSVADDCSLLKDNVTTDQKSELVKGVIELPVKVLQKSGFLRRSY